MGAWKDWEVGMIEGGFTRAERIRAEAAIKGTLSDPLVRRSEVRIAATLALPRCTCGEEGENATGPRGTGSINPACPIDGYEDAEP